MKRNIFNRREGKKIGDLDTNVSLYYIHTLTYFRTHTHTITFCVKGHSNKF